MNIFRLVHSLYFVFSQETFQQYKRNENIPEFPSDDAAQSQEELQRVDVDGGEKQKLLIEEDD